MSNNKILTKTTKQNFKLYGFNSILIGLYFILFSYIIKLLIDGFLSEMSMMGMMSIQIIEIIGFSLSLLLIFLTAFAIYFSNKRQLKKQGSKIWNSLSKTKSIRYFLFFFTTVLFSSLILETGYPNYLAVFILMMIGVYFLIIAIKSPQKKALKSIAFISIILAIITFLIPTYWYSSFNIVGVSFFVYGLMIKPN